MTFKQLKDELEKEQQKCLVTEARENCQCKDCISYRRWRDFAIKWEVTCKVNNILSEAMDKAGLLNAKSKGGK